MDKSKSIRLCASLLFLFTMFVSCGNGGDGKVKLSWQDVPIKKQNHIVVNFYVENSGSMNGYMCDGSEFKNVIHYYANELEDIADTTKLFFINSVVIPFHNDIDSYTLGMTPLTFNKYGGVTSSSSLDKMLGQVLNKTDQNTLSIFVSDCILAVPYGQAEKYFSIAKDNVKQVFRKAIKKHKDLGVEILCLNSRFKGKYYQYGEAPREINCQRPYYVWLIGSQKLIGEVRRKINESELDGLKNTVGFSSCANIPFTIVNEHGVAESQPSITSRVKGKKAQFIIRADLSSCLQNDAFLLDKNNYEKKSPLVSIDEVHSIDNPDYTHEIMVSIFDNAKLDECIKIKTMNTPRWVEDKNDMTGKNLNKTAGIKYIIGGVTAAFLSGMQQDGIKFTIK